MLKVKPKYLSKRGKREFVVLTVEDFERMQRFIEDANDLRTLRAATTRNRKARYFTPAEVARQLLPRSPRKPKAT
jgi:PHD/YefM family antitoxin component YafN of YafNO toxin-antitoxin module